MISANLHTYHNYAMTAPCKQYSYIANKTIDTVPIGAAARIIMINCTPAADTIIVESAPTLRELHIINCKNITLRGTFTCRLSINNVEIAVQNAQDLTQDILLELRQLQHTVVNIPRDTQFTQRIDAKNAHFNMCWRRCSNILKDYTNCTVRGFTKRIKCKSFQPEIVAIMEPKLYRYRAFVKYALKSWTTPKYGYDIKNLHQDNENCIIYQGTALKATVNYNYPYWTNNSMKCIRVFTIYNSI